MNSCNCASFYIHWVRPYFMMLQYRYILSYFSSSLNHQTPKASYGSYFFPVLRDVFCWIKCLFFFNVLNWFHSSQPKGEISTARSILRGLVVFLFSINTEEQCFYLTLYVIVFCCTERAGSIQLVPSRWHLYYQH